MTVYVGKSSGKYNWTVRVGRGRGSSIKSRHRKKTKALASGRSVASKRGDVLKEQMAQTGQWRTVRSYA